MLACTHRYTCMHIHIDAHICLCVGIYVRGRKITVCLCVYGCVFLVVYVMSSGLRSDCVYSFVHTSGCLYMYASLVMPQLSSAI